MSEWDVCDAVTGRVFSRLPPDLHDFSCSVPLKKAAFTREAPETTTMAACVAATPPSTDRVKVGDDAAAVRLC